MIVEGKYDFDLTDRQHRDVLSIIASLLLEDETLEVSKYRSALVSNNSNELS